MATSRETAKVCVGMTLAAGSLMAVLLLPFGIRESGLLPALLGLLVLIGSTAFWWGQIWMGYTGMRASGSALMYVGVLALACQTGLGLSRQAHSSRDFTAIAGLMIVLGIGLVFTACMQPRR